MLKANHGLNQTCDQISVSLCPAALTMENLEGDFFVPGTELLDSAPAIWKEIEARGKLSLTSGSAIILNFLPHINWYYLY